MSRVLCSMHLPDDLQHWQHAIPLSLCPHSSAALAKTANVVVTNEKERMLVMHVVRFPEALSDAIADLLPNRLTEYLYELTDIFNSFYVECQVRHAHQTPDTHSMLPAPLPHLYQQLRKVVGLYSLKKPAGGYAAAAAVTAATGCPL